MKHELFYDDKLDVLRMNFHGLFKKEDSEEFYESIQLLLKGKRRRFLLCNFEDGGFQVPRDKEYREFLTSFYSELGLEKIAVFNLSPPLRMLSKVIISSTGAKNVKIFRTEEEAVAWLKEGTNE